MAATLSRERAALGVGRGEGAALGVALGEGAVLGVVLGEGAVLGVVLGEGAVLGVGAGVGVVLAEAVGVAGEPSSRLAANARLPAGAMMANATATTLTSTAMDLTRCARLLLAFMA